MNVSEFINQALAIKANELDEIIRLTGGTETDWLEFKAATKAQSPQEDLESNEADYIFNVVKALVSMANSTGGLVVLGVDDNGEAIGLDSSGYTGDKDKFTRDLSQRGFLRESWRTKCSGQWKWKSTTDQVDFKPVWAKHQGKEVIAFVVSPRKSSHGPLILTHTKSKNAVVEEVVFIRAGGDRALTSRFTPQEAELLWARRDDNSLDPNPKFSTWIKELQKTEPVIYLSTVNAYCNELIEAREPDENLFVALEATARLPGSDRPRRRNTTDNDYMSSHGPRGSQVTETGSFLKIATQVYPSFLIGEPGAGKSTSLLKFARDINVTNSTTPDKWALYVPLSGYTSDGLRDLVCREVPPLNWADISLALESGQLTLLLDGLNESPAIHYEKCSAEISDLFKALPRARIIVSTRSSHLPRFAKKTIELRKMERPQQHQFVKNYLSHEHEQVSEFWEAMKHKSTAPIILRNPLLLRMAAWLWTENNELPDGLAALYSRFFEAWLRREANKSLDAGETCSYSEDEIHDALALLAHSMQYDGLVACSPAYAEEKLKPLFGSGAKSLLDQTVQGLMIEKTNNGASIRFKHQTIQDYLVAVYLTSRNQYEIRKSGDQFDQSRWSMPIVFAFELFDHPPEGFIRAAWQIAPLLVCSALRDEEWLQILPEPIDRHPAAQNDLWVRGIIRCMRGESVDGITRSLAYLGRTPSPGRHFQKHPLPEELSSTLEGLAFWYALSSWPQGRLRLERLQHLLIDRRNLWLELLPHATLGQPNWLTQLTSAQKLIAGELEASARTEAITTASVVELCFLVRNKIISDEEFNSNWKRALNVYETGPLELELLALLTTKKVKTSQFNGAQRALIKQSIGQSPELSPRIVNVLVGEKILEAKGIRRNPSQMNGLVSRASPLRVKQLMAKGVLRREDFSAQQLKQLFERIETPKDIGFLLECGLAGSRQEIPQSIRDRVHGY